MIKADAPEILEASTLDLKVAKPEITTCYGIYVMDRAALILGRKVPNHFPHTVVMPCCGYTQTFETIGDLPRSGLPCPCGDKRCWVVKYKEEEPRGD